MSALKAYPLLSPATHAASRSSSLFPVGHIFFALFPLLSLPFLFSLHLLLFWLSTGATPYATRHTGGCVCRKIILINGTGFRWKHISHPDFYF
jgi:hypothetical protein